ncbi:pantetheine-phosphate adenylyltransferase, partial [Patescibacteria group bacterium]|nr:pantetheine-phosphate adenylyltransferase [Patescibacteria group bacterium]
VGFVGLPNVGKSSLLNELTRAKAKVANYKFTTLEPNLGVYYDLVLADIPGLIEGASRGKGLGIKFLRHIERTKIIFHFIPADSADPVADYKIVRGELEKYSKQLLEKPEYLFVSKSDVANSDKQKEIIEKLKEFNKNILQVSIFDWEAVERVKEILNGLIKEKTQPRRPKGSGFRSRRQSRLSDRTSEPKASENIIEQKEVIVGGTFDLLHAGHKALLRKAFELGEVSIGLVSDKMAKRIKGGPVGNFESRKKELGDFIGSEIGKAAGIFRIDDKFGPALKEDYDYIVVSPETYENSLEINSQRQKINKKPIEIIEIEYVLAEDKKPISSTRIYNGEISREGKLLNR